MHIPNYHIEKKIGQGGMALVYLAEHTIMKRQVALKVMSASLVQEKGFKESFLHEGAIVAQLEHPNIVRIHDVNIVDDIYYMSMEYLSGGNLKEKLQQKKYILPDCITLLEQVGAGLSFAHKHGYIHRDIKPANILFSKRGEAILTDFGIAKLQDTSSELTKMGYMLGTAQYMSPEQAAALTLDQRSDVYSLGLVFYESLTGEKVVGTKTGVQAIYCHTTAPAPTFPAEYKHLQPILDKVLAKDPNDRFNTIQDFVDALLATATRNHNTRPDFEPTIQRATNYTNTSHLPRWLKPTAIIATLSAVLLAGFFYFTQNNKDNRSADHQDTTVTLPSSLKKANQTTSRTYEPHVYYDQLETKLDQLAQEAKTLATLSPNHKKAQTTLNDVLDRYHSLASTLLKTMNLPQARIVINKGLQLSNQHKALQALKKSVDRDAHPLSAAEKKQIRSLHKTASRHTEAKRYTAPEGNNALELYQNILVIDPQNKQAIGKINDIIAQFEQKINSTLNKNTDEASKLLNQAIAIAPFNKNLSQLQQSIKTARDTQ